MTRTARPPAGKPRSAAAADASPELAELLALEGAALAKRLRPAVSKAGVLKSTPHATWRLIAPALESGWTGADNLVAAALRLGPQGEPDAECRKALGGWLRAAARKEWRGPAAALFGVATGPAGKAPAACGLHDADARFAWLRREWQPKSATLALDYRSATPEFACRIAGQDILAGRWEAAATFGGAALEPVGPWEYLCWQADEDGEYFEARLPLAGGAALERQLFLARHVPWAYLADTVRGPQEGEWTLRWNLPAAAGLTGRPGLKSRGLRLAGASAPIDAVPLWLPPDPLGGGAGTLRLTNGELRAETSFAGTAATLAVAFCWAPDGELPPTNWKRLTVTHDRRLVRPDEAHAFRVAAGGRQCVAFRSLKPEFRTAFLGHQTFDECLIGWLNPAVRDVEAWLRIE